jgi:RNA methyltransferase, TrmH family
MSNPRADRVRDVAKLAGRPARLKRRQFLAEGPQAVREALLAHRNNDAGTPVVAEIYATAACLDRLPELADLVRDLPLRLATDEVLAAMADTVNPQGIVAVCNFIDVTLDEVLARRPALLSVLVRVQDPGNAGTILRAADSAGADAVLLTAASVDIYNPKAVRSTVGSIFHLPVVMGLDFDALMAGLRGAGIAVLAADGYGKLNLDELQDRSALRRLGIEGEREERGADNGLGAALPGAAPAGAAPPEAGAAVVPVLEEPTAWLFGNEAQGLSDAELAAADHRVAVPVYGAAESLNVGTAATVCLYASARAQRRR